MTKPTINLVGAFDRYNYGDLLFPQVVSRWLEKFRPDLCANYSIRCFGLIPGDLSQVGGGYVEPLHRLLSEPITPGSLVLLAGGDLLPARVSGLCIDLAKNSFEELVFKVLRKMFGHRLFETIMNRKLNIHSSFPWIIPETLFQGKAKVAYNAVGGASLSKFEESERKSILTGLSDSSYRSFRDQETLLAVEPVSAKLAPDSAVLISDLMKHCGRTVLPRLNDLMKGDKYIVVQCGESAAKGDSIKLLARQIDRIAEKTGLRVLCLPLGVARNHNDLKILKLLKKNMQTNALLMQMPTVLDSMFAIAHAELFIGSSLHGNITAISFGVPYVALAPKISKLSAFLKTWMSGPFSSAVEFSEVEKRYDQIRCYDRRHLTDSAERLKQEANLNFEAIFKLCDQKNG